MPSEMPKPLSRLTDDTLPTGERLQFIEALFVHDADEHWRELPNPVVDVASVIPASWIHTRAA